MEDYFEELGDSLEFLKGNVLVLVTTRALRMFAVFLVLPFYPFYELALGGSYFSIGLISPQVQHFFHLYKDRVL